MGKKIDGFVLSTFAAAAFYFYFRGVFQSRILCLALALLCCIILIKAVRRLTGRLLESDWLKKRRLRKNAGNILMHLACLPKAEATERIEELFHKCYAGEYALELIQLHPSCTLTDEAIFGMWKQHQGEKELVVCASCRCSPSGKLLSGGLRMPKLALIDSEQLAQMIAEHPDTIVAPEGEKGQRFRLRLKRVGDLFIRRKNAPRCILIAFAMFVMYLFSAKISYLAVSLILILLALVSLRRQSRPAKLF